MEIGPCGNGESDVTDRAALCASGSRKAASIGAFDIRPVIPSQRGRDQKRIERVLRQIAILLVDGVALDQHATAFAIVADPADAAAPGDVLTVEWLEVDWSPVPHINDLGFLPIGGEEQGEDESNTDHDAFVQLDATGQRPESRTAATDLGGRLHELDPDHVALFPGDLAGPAGRCSLELQLKLRLDELRVLDPSAGQTRRRDTRCRYEEFE
jgi:hypothetical protein